jgi:hypothetical protein
MAAEALQPYNLAREILNDLCFRTDIPVLPASLTRLVPISRLRFHIFNDFQQSSFFQRSHHLELEGNPVFVRELCDLTEFMNIMLRLCDDSGKSSTCVRDWSRLDGSLRVGSGRSRATGVDVGVLVGLEGLLGSGLVDILKASP